MAWSFRKSAKIGPMRVTLGKTGVGVSAGVKGARIGVGADGHATVSGSIPGTGLTYRRRLRANEAAASEASSGSGCGSFIFAAALLAVASLVVPILLIGAVIIAAWVR